jgi:hypothetical protein
MDTRWIGRAALITGIAVILALWRADTGIAISGGTPAQRAMGEWAEDRFRDAGIGIPSLDLRFHEERNGCDGRLGLFESGTAHFCGVHANELSRRTLMHELAHAWIDSHVSASLEVRFLRLRRLESWNDPEVEWELRGTEHAAEIVAWALDGQGTGTELPSIPDNEPRRLAQAYQLLTGKPLPD